MFRREHCKHIAPASLLIVLCGGVGGGMRLAAQAASASASASALWDAAFPDWSGSTPLHFTASYVDARGTHRLEEWRQGQVHLRRRTDSRIDLHADSTGRPTRGQSPDYLWQIIDVDRRIVHRVSTAGMLHLGMLYSYYSMAHVLVRPAGRFTLTRTTEPTTAAAGLPPVDLHASCAWWQIEAAGQPTTRLCWSSHYGVPLQMWTTSQAGWRRTFQIDSLSTTPIAREVFTTSTAGFQVRDVDEIEDSD